MTWVKITTGVVALAAVVSVMFCWVYLEQVDRENAKYLDAKLQLAQVKDALAAKKRNLAERQAAAKEVQALVASKAQAEAALSEAVKLMGKAQATEKEVRASIATTIAKVESGVASRRSHAGSQRYPEMKLRNGKVLSDATVRKIEESGVSFSHAGGIATVELALLPESLLVEFDLGPHAVLARLKELAASLDETKDKDAAAQAGTPPMPSDGTAKANKLTPAERENLLILETSLTELKSKLNRAVQNSAVFQTQMAQASAAVTNAQERGIPTTTYRTAHQQAAANLASTSSYIGELQSEIQRLEVKILQMKQRL